MPTYEYRCQDCGEHLEVVQSFRDDALTECPQCQGTLKKVFGNVGIVLKGSGFYKNDSRSAGSKSSSSASGDSKSSGADSPAKSDTKTETKASPSAGSAAS
jgi:putative FmdB family regulatory protein